MYDEIYATYGGVRLDLGCRPDVARRGFWSVDRLHPSELGHRALARAYGELLRAEGLAFELPDLAASGGFEPSWRRDLAWMVAQGAPWFGRRARDLGPWAVRLALTEARRPGQPTPL